MISQSYESTLKRQLPKRQYLLLSLLVILLDTLRDVRLETLAQALPLPILFESRRKKVQRFLTLGVFNLKTFWVSVFEVFAGEQLKGQTTVYVALDRTTWGQVNILMASVIWRGRTIPLYWQFMENLGNSHYDEQTALLSQALSMLANHQVVLLGDREFCSVDLARWLGDMTSLTGDIVLFMWVYPHTAGCLSGHYANNKSANCWRLTAIKLNTIYGVKKP